MQLPHSHPLAVLAEKCLEHLAREEAFLVEARKGLIELNEALRKQGLGLVDTARVKQAQLVQFSDELSAQRTTLCHDFSLVFNLPAHQITLSLLVSLLPAPWAEAIAAARDRLQPIAAEVHFLNNRNTALLQYCRSYVQRLLSGAAGQEPAVRYGPTGTQLETSFHTLFVMMG